MVWCDVPWSKVVAIMGSDIYKGISSSDIERRKKIYGSNKIIINFKKNIKSFIKNIFKIYILIYILMIIYLFKNNYYISGVIGISFIFIYLALRLVSYFSALKTHNHMNKFNYMMYRVIRDGKTSSIQCDEIVVGDIIRIYEGMMVPADIRIIESDGIKASEVNLTGNKTIIDKYETMIDDKILSLSDMKNMIFKGSVIVKGKGLGVVTDVGEKTYFGAMTKGIKPFDKNLDKTFKKVEGKINKYFLFIMAIIIFLLYLFYDINSFVNIEMINVMISLVVINIPIINIVIYYIVTKYIFYKKGIKSVKLDSFKRFKDINMIFIDIQGYIKNEQLILSSIFTADDIKNTTSNNINKLISNSSSFNNIKDSHRKFIETAVLTSKGSYDPDKDICKGNVYDTAVLKFAYKRGIFRGNLLKLQQFIGEIPYDVNRKMYTSINRYKRNYRINTKGGTAEILSRCRFIYRNGIEEEISSDDIEKIKSADYNMSQSGYITVAFAYRNFKYKPSSEENIESSMTFIGICGFYSEEIEGVQANIEMLKNLGVRPILFSDNNLIVTKAIAEEFDIIKNNTFAVSGMQLSTLNEEEFENTVIKTRAYCEVDSNTKQRIIDTYEKHGSKVAIFGENFIDIPTMSSSYISFAKGDNADKSVYKVSDAAISDNYLSSFISIFKQSKLYCKNIDKYIEYVMYLIIMELVLTFVFLDFGSSINYLMLKMMLGFNIVIIPLLLQPILLNESDDGGKVRFFSYIPGGIIEATSIVLILDLNLDVNKIFIIISGIIAGIISSSIIRNKIKIKDNLFIIINYMIIAFVYIIITVLLFLNSIIAVKDCLLVIFIFVLFMIIELLLEKWRG